MKELLDTTLVLKVGTSTLVRENDGVDELDVASFVRIGGQVDEAVAAGWGVLLVSSGARKRLPHIGWDGVVDAWDRVIGVETRDFLFTDDHLDMIPGESVVLKRDEDEGGQYTILDVPKNDAKASLIRLRRAMGQTAAHAGIALQELAHGGIVAGLSAFDAAKQTLIDSATDADSPELGVLCFADRIDGLLQLRPSAAYRLKPGSKEEQWAGVELQSVPAEAIDVTTDVVERTLDYAGVSAVLARVDLFFDKTERRFKVRELNTRNPAIGLGGPTSRDLQAHLLGEQLAALAKFKL